MAKALGFKVGANGMFSRSTEELVKGGLDASQVARVLLGPAFTKENLKNVESIYAALSNDPNKDAKLKDFREYLAREGLKEPQLSVSEDDVGFLGRLRDRIVNRGYELRYHLSFLFFRNNRVFTTRSKTIHCKWKSMQMHGMN